MDRCTLHVVFQGLGYRGLETAGRPAAHYSRVTLSIMLQQLPRWQIKPLEMHHVTPVSYGREEGEGEGGEGGDHCAPHAVVPFQTWGCCCWCACRLLGRRVVDSAAKPGVTRVLR